MKQVLSSFNMKQSDAQAIANGTSGRTLMQRAAQGVLDAVNWQPPVAVVCGSGNNGGDGFALALMLHNLQLDCTVVLLQEKFSPDGKWFFEQCQQQGVKVAMFSKVRLTDFNTVVDCIFGTGFCGNVDGVHRQAVEAINNSGAFVVSVDINSGLDSDSGMAELCVKSNLTVAVGGFKTGHFLNMAKDVMRQKVNVDIGITPVLQPFLLAEQCDVAPLFAPRKNFSHKGTFGYMALVGGSSKYSGAMVLATTANCAMRSGAGVVKVATPKSVCNRLDNLTEVTLFPLSEQDGNLEFVQEEWQQLLSNVKTVAFGMGIGLSQGAKQALQFVLQNFGGTLVVDADALTLLSQLPFQQIVSTSCKLVLTPHMGEFCRLCGLTAQQVYQNPVHHAMQYAAKTGAVVLLKGPSTIVTDGSQTYIVQQGCAGMATAGSGDVLAGVLCATAARSTNLLLAAVAAAYVNGKAGEAAQQKYGSVAMVASDTVSCIAQVVHQLEQSNN